MSKCDCMKATFTKIADEKTLSVHLCCGKCDVLDISENAETMRICFSPKHKCGADCTIGGEGFPDFPDFPDSLDWIDVMESELPALEEHPDFGEYYLKRARMQTFADWPKTLKQTPEQLSAAGFSYTQKGDRVICFCCGLGLRQWEENDIPWEQHALHGPDCEYLHLLKGPEYIASVKEKFAVDEPDLSTLFIEN